MSKKQPAAKAGGLSSGGKSNQASTAIKGKPVTKQASQSEHNATAVQSSNSRNSILIWLDANIDVNSDDYRNSIRQLQSIIRTVHVFNNADQCVQYLKQIKNENVLMIVSGSLGQRTVQQVHNMPQLTAVFVFCGDISKHELWTKNWSKIKGIFTDITDLSDSLKRATRNYDDDSIAFSLVSASDISKKGLDELDQSFMYTQLIKEILLELEDDDQSVKKLVTYCRNRFEGDEEELKKISMLETGYHDKSPIWWYTFECCIYHLLNWALRDQEVDVIIKMAFFICDLHRHIQRLHLEQSKEYQNEFIVYRGVSMSQAKFAELKNTKGGLISFNNFVSTSRDPQVSMRFATKNFNDPTIIGILFIITVDPSISSAPFASLDDISYYKYEKEILFSMHTVFRIGEMKQSKDNKRVWHVNLTLTADSDKQLNALIERMREEIQGSTALYRLGALMIKLGEFDKAEEVFEALRKRTSDELELGNIYYQLGHIKDNQRQYGKALTFYQQALTNYLNTLHPDHPNVATCYNNIGLVYDNNEQYSEALSFYQKALEIYKKTLSDDDPNVATAYNSIGLVHNSMGEYPQALTLCKTALDIFNTSLPPTHPLLATSYNNIGLVYANMKKYPEAIASYERAVHIGTIALPSNHPNLEAYKKNLEHAKNRRSK